MYTPRHDFQPDYRNIEDAARNRKAKRVPLYEHGFHPNVMEKILGKPFWQMLFEGDHADRVEGYRRFCAFGAQCGYDVIPVEFGATYLVQGGLALCGRAPALIRNMADIENYPWGEMLGRYIAAFEPHFKALAEALPPGMKAIGGVGNGIFETTQDFVPLMDLSLLMIDEPEVYTRLWQKVGDMFIELWSWFLDHYSDAFAVCRMGDDLGYRSATMLSPTDIRRHILPQYQRIVELVHAKDKPFLLHSCGRIFDVMEDIIREVKIDAKHSNEDAIAPFKDWLDRYNDRIGLFGGVDMDLLCRADEATIRARTLEVLNLAERYRGFAIGCGNSIADYVPAENFLTMVETVREYRKD
jgi:uroporphyrinogen decarboxylase